MLDRRSVATRKRGMNAGDRVFLLHQRTDSGIVASGRVIDGVILKEQHLEDPLKLASYVGVRWDRVVSIEKRLPIEDLVSSVPDHDWNHIYASGQQVHAPNDAALEARWAAYVTKDASTAGPCKRYASDPCVTRVPLVPTCRSPCRRTAMPYRARFDRGTVRPGYGLRTSANIASTRPGSRSSVKLSANTTPSASGIVASSVVRVSARRGAMSVCSAASRGWRATTAKRPSAGCSHSAAAAGSPWMVLAP